MKLATYKDGSRDGQLVVVSRDLATGHYASGIATRLQQVLDDWNFVSPQLEDLATSLDHGKARHAFPFDPARCMAPLPRAYQWADGSAFVNHVELVRRARNAEMPASFWTDPLMYQGGSDDLLGPRDDIVAQSEDWGIDFEAEVAVVTGDVAMGTSADAAIESIRLVMLANDVSLRNLIPAELAKGFGFFQSKPATAFSPLAVTPDALGDAWRDGRLHARVRSTYNGELVGDCDSGPEMHFSFHELIAHVTKTRRFTAGTILGSGTVSNADRARGVSCLAERRMIETIEAGAPATPFMAVGDRIEIEAFDAAGGSPFGKIDQQVIAAKGGPS